MLAEQSKQDPAERFTRNQDRQEITGDQIQQMMDLIQRLMKDGRMAEAQQLLEQFNRMMQNMQVQQSQSGDSGEGRPGNGVADKLGDTLRAQRRLSDQAFREMQRQFSGNGEMGEGTSPRDLADRQERLRRQLQEQSDSLTSQDGETLQEARRRLGEAAESMQDAERNLRGGDMAGAMQDQADAIEAMRDGLRALEGQGDTRQSYGQPQGAEGWGRSDARQGASTGQGGSDPLGRAQSQDESSENLAGGTLGSDESLQSRSQDLYGEIQRRLGEDRPAAEKDYLNRLLDRF